LDGDGLKFETDFRQIYATILQDWLGFDNRSVLGQAYKTLDLFS
jgi:hypothetical protein